MSRKHQIVHLISFVAIMVSLFSPVLTLPVIAQDQQPEPEVTLTTGDEGSTPDAQAPAAPTNTDPVEGPPSQGDAPDTEQPPVQNDPPTQDDPPAEPALIAVVPAAPVITDATCSDGTVYAQTAAAPVTDGVNYEIGAPDAAGIFTVTATLTDASVYTWADSGLAGWTVVENTATSSGTLTLCPIPEPEEPIEQEIPVESGEGSDTGESTPEADSVISTPNTNARSSSMAPNAIDGVELTYAFETDKDHAAYGEAVTFTVTITNVGTADAGVYSFTTTFSIGGYTFVNPQFGPGDMPPGSICAPNLNNDTRIECRHDGINPIAPGQTHVYTATVIVDSTESCGIIVSRGGGNNFESDIELWAVGSRNGIGDSPSLNTSINCPTEEPAPLLTYEISADKATANPGDDITFTIIVTNNGTADSGQYQFLTQLSRSGPQLTLKDPLNVTIPEGISCGDLVPGSPVFNCNNTSGEPAILAPGDEHKFTFVAVASGDSCGESRTRGGGDTNQNPDLWAEGSRYREDPAPTFSITINCDSDLTIELYTATEIGPGDSFNYTLYIDNVGSQVSGDYAVEIVVPQGISITSVPGTCQQDAGAGTITCSSTGVPPGDFHLHTIPASVDTDAATCTDVVSTATGVAGNWMTGRGSSEVINTIITPDCYPEFSLSMNTDTPLVSSGDEVSVDIVTTNTTSSHRGTTFSINANFDPAIFPAADAQYTAPDGVECTTNAAEGWFDCTAPRLAGDDSLVITMTLTVSDDLSPTECVNTTISAVGGNQGPWDAESRDPGASVAIGINCDVPSPLSMEFVADIPTITQPDERLGFTVTVTNTSSEPVTGVSVIGFIPAAFASSEWTVTDTDGSADCVIQTLEGTGALCEGMTVPAQVGDVPGTLTVKYSLADGFTYPESVCGDHQALAGMQHPTFAEEGVILTSSVTIDCEPTLVHTVTADRTSVAPGELVEYTITVENTSGWDFLPPADGGQIFLAFLVNQQHGTFEGTWESSIPNSGCMELTEGTDGYDALACYLDIGGVIEAGTTGTFKVPVRAVAEPSDALCASSIETQLSVFAEPGTYLPGPDVAIDCSDLTIQLTADPTAPLGEEFKYDVFTRNWASSPPVPFEWELHLPDEVSYVRAVENEHTCEYDAARHVVTCAGDTPAVTKYAQIWVMADPVRGAEACDNLTTTATGTVGGWREVGGTATGPTVITGDGCEVDLSLTMIADKQYVSSGESVTFTIVWSNEGAATYHAVSSFQANYDTATYFSQSETTHTHPTHPTHPECWEPTVSGNFNCYTWPMVSGESLEFTLTLPVQADLPADVCVSTPVTVGGDQGPWNFTPIVIPVYINCDETISLEKTNNTGGSVDIGDPFTYTITVTNEGPVATGDYAFTDELPAGVELVGDITAPAGTECTPSTAAGITTIECSGSGLPLESQAGPPTHVYSYQARANYDLDPDVCGPDVINTVTGTVGPWTVAGSQAESTTTVLCEHELSISQTDDMTDAQSIGLNEPFTYTITVTNTGTAAAGGFSFVNVLPPGIIPSGDLDERCTAATEQGLIHITCEDNEVPIGENNGISFEIPVIAVDTEGSTVCDLEFVQNQVHGDVGNWADGEDEAYERTYVECISSVYYSITPLVSPAVPGGTIGFEIVVHNTGSTRITSFDTTDTPLPLLPDGEEWTLTPRLNGALIDPVNFPTSLAAGDILTITIESSEIPTGLTLPETEWCTDWTVSSTFIARFSWGEDQQIPGSATVQVNCTGLSIEQDVSSERITPGGEVTYTITVTNHGNTTVSPLSVSHDSSETGTVFSNWRVTSGTALECGLNENDDPGCTFLTLAPQESAVITITGDAPLLPTAEQCAPVASQANFAYGETLPAARFNAGITPPYTQIDSEPVSTQIDCQPDVSVEMNGVLDLGANNRVDAGDTITYTLTVTNSGNMSLYDIVVTDDMADLEWDKDLSITELQPGETETFTATYTITQADIDAGELVSTASVSASLVPSPAMTRVQFVGLAQIAEPLPILPESVGNSITETTVLTQEPGILLEVSSAANTGDDDELNLNDTITYTFTVTNTGNVTLTNIDLIDELEGLVFTDGSTIASLAPGVEGTLTATYTVTQADVDAGSVVSCTDVTATDPGSNPVSETDVCVTNQVAQPVPVTPTPEPTATPEVPVTPEPTTPDVPATPDAPVTPAATEDAAQAVTKLPETGHGAGILTPILWIAATIGVLALGVGGATVRRSHTR